MRRKVRVACFQRPCCTTCDSVDLQYAGVRPLFTRQFTYIASEHRVGAGKRVERRMASGGVKGLDRRTVTFYDHTLCVRTGQMELSHADGHPNLAVAWYQ